MLRIHVSMKFTNQPVKRTPVILYLDTNPEHPIQGATDRSWHSGIRHITRERQGHD